MKINFDKLYERVNKRRKELAETYDISESAVVWIGNNRFIVVKDDKEIRI